MEKQNFLVKTILSSLLILVFSVIAVGDVNAEDGAQIQTKGEITLFDDTSPSTSESVSSSSMNPSSSSNVMIKPEGRLPSTGELIKYSFLISGILLILLLLLIWWLNRRQKGRSNE
ncbi:hypothetical protein A5821_002193 [Enterococcus sp. 7F3_DIV0205]|uniref:Gram-positive cocci surface proteins LPxTG domain-containing protein n=1 Tax=Candidatus Enterococcus palustris TaxID=1834189 RepID=A0AAQ3W9J0_9ENTE|nr:LPXTG cell wall anchor domain-containing protein [Enterococcus sp. 7F3_DIV0205]OTN82632.1 hypothetical protein A5821_002543 [Enterococcus sp. 7F3_DIV0205]